MPAISNSSPLILYSRLRRLDLVHELFDEIVVPPAVQGEVLAEGGWHGDALDFALLPWLRVQPAPPDRLADLIHAIDPGEAEAIALAETYPHPTPLLLDDRIARRIARERGLFVIGSAGVLVLAKDSGLVPAIRPLLDALLAAGLYLGAAAFDEVFKVAGESRVG